MVRLSVGHEAERSGRSGAERSDGVRCPPVFLPLVRFLDVLKVQLTDIMLILLGNTNGNKKSQAIQYE